MIRKFVIGFIFLFVLLVSLGGLGAVWGYFYITRDLPKLDRVEDYRPPAVTQVYSKDHVLIAEFFDADNRRYPVRIDEIPVHVRNAFLAAEDAKFYSHPGIDVVSIFRAAIKNLQSGSAKQGGSTITQQVVKNLLLSSQKNITRKLKEAILSYQIEQRLSKDEILQIYLNQIFFGNRSYGIQAAARAYYQKDVSQLSIAEAAMLAGLPKAPSRFSPLTNFKEAKVRQAYVIDQMLNYQFISEQEADQAREEELSFHRWEPITLLRAPYYATEVRRRFEELLPELSLDTGGYEIETAADVEANALAQSSLNRGIEAVDKRRGWRGPKDHIPNANVAKFLEKHLAPPIEDWLPYEKYPALLQQIVHGTGKVLLPDGSQGQFLFEQSGWAKRFLNAEGKVNSTQLAQHLRIGDVIEVSVGEGRTPREQLQSLVFDQTPELQGALVLLEPSSGEVKALVGGYDYKSTQYNRATQAFRQPGSAFKPIIYLAAVEQFGYSPATIVHDERRVFKIGEQYWQPGNFDESFLGPITLRTALEKSRNIISADIISRIGVEWAINYARKLGIESPLGANLSISLGSSEVTPLELTRAYGVFANSGVLLPSIFIRKVLDRDGKVLYSATDTQIEKAERAISPQAAFVMANMMRGVVERGTAWRIRELGRPSAGKTGTSNQHMDTWYVGYTPQWACGVWVGFDIKKKLGSNETGGSVAAPIWLSFMKGFLEAEEQRQLKELIDARKREAEELGIEFVQPEAPLPPDFVPPEGVVGRWVDKTTGAPTAPDAPNAIFDYFVEGTEPEVTRESQETSSYLQQLDL